MVTEPVTEADEAVLDAYLDKIKNEYKDAWTEENWEEEFDKHPLFMSKAPGEGEELHPLTEALQKLKWDEFETPRDKAVQFKEEGNIMFKAKKYKNAVISYTAALKEPKIEEDKDLTAILYCNRATAHFYLGNYRSGLSDCAFALKFNKKSVKAMYKGAECCLNLHLFDDVAKWCEMCLSIDPKDQKTRDLRFKSEELRKSVEKEKRKKERSNMKRSQLQTKILGHIKLSGIQIQENDEAFLDLLENPSNPQQSAICLSDDDQAHLKWPVVFLYPEYGQTDFIEAFHDNSTFDSHLMVMFSECPPWDSQKKYRYDTVQVYYENRKKGKLVKLQKHCTLFDAMRKDGYIVQMGSPSFIIMVPDTPFEKMYSQKFSEI